MVMVTKFPYASTAACFLASARLVAVTPEARATNLLLKSTPPEIRPTKGMIRSSMNEVESLVNAAPMTKATAMSMRLPLSANSLNSLNMM